MLFFLTTFIRLFCPPGLVIVKNDVISYKIVLFHQHSGVFSGCQITNYAKKT